MALVRFVPLAAAAVATSLSPPTTTSSLSLGRKKKKAAVRVVSYNVLSDSLCTTNYYCNCEKDAADNSARLERVKRKLQEQVIVGVRLEIHPTRSGWGSGAGGGTKGGRGWKEGGREGARVDVCVWVGGVT